MFFVKIFLLNFIIFAISFANLPEGFVYLQDVVKVQQSVRYATNQNFTAKKVKGYNKPVIILTKEAAFALKKANEILNKQGYELVVYDGFRPQMAVQDFVDWSKTKEESAKHFYFPDLTKEEIFEKGFVATKSGHSRGSTVDLTIIKKGQKVCEIKEEIRNNKVFLNDCTLDMGMHFDFFGTESWAQSPLMLPIYNERRMILIKAMQQVGFKSASGEWWHFVLINEPFKNTYFEFEIQ